MSRFLESAKKKQEHISNAQLVDMVMNFLIAGRDTTACALTWTVFELMQHPEAEQRLVQEARAAAKERGAESGLLRDLDMEQTFACIYGRMPWTKARPAPPDNHASRVSISTRVPGPNIRESHSERPEH